MSDTLKESKDRVAFASEDEVMAHLHALWSNVDQFDVQIIRHFKTQPRKKRGVWTVYLWKKGSEHRIERDLLHAFKADAP